MSGWEKKKHTFEPAWHWLQYETHPIIVTLPKQCRAFVLLMQPFRSAKLLWQSPDSLRSLLCPAAATYIHIDRTGNLHTGNCPHSYPTILGIIRRVRLRIQLVLECASCSCCWRRRPASSPAGENGCWGFEPSWRTPSSPWWSGGGFLVDSSRGRGTWSIRRAPGAHSNDTARRDVRRTYSGGEERGVKHESQKCGRDVETAWG